MLEVVLAKLTHSSISWLFVGAMFLLCGVLGALQYRWIGEVSVAERDRLQQRLQADLSRLSQDFNSELTSACRALLPSAPAPGDKLTGDDLASRFSTWKKSARHPQVFQTIALAVPQGDNLVLYRLDPQSGSTHEAQWPADWSSLQARLQARMSPEGWRQRGTPRSEAGGHLFEVPLFGARTNRGPGGPDGPGRPGRTEAAWLVVDLDTHYIGEVMLPELVQRYIGNQDGGLDYQATVFTRMNPQSILYQSSPNAAAEIGDHADAAVGLGEIQMDQFFQRPEPPPGLRNPAFPAANFRASPNMGRWQMNVRNRAGSLEAVVSSARRRSMAVIAGILLLLVATAGALLSFTRRSQRLAQLQMDFVAGVSHELRTPLAVIYGAAYNLRGAVAQNPNQVEKYGVLLQQESGRLRDLVEQILRFSSAEAGSVIREREPISIHDLIDQAMDASKSVVQNANCVVDQQVDPELPIVLGDPIALKHALQNLVSNAAKYGQNKTTGSHWIGLSAASIKTLKNTAVEIRVADHGPGIPADEKDHVFDAFFRGRRAIQDQIHGTGLGLNLVKKIIEAHGGSVRVESEPMKQTEFIVRLPGAMA